MIKLEDYKMKIVIAMDSYKGSLTSWEAGLAAKEGIEQVMNAEVVIKPLADGGEGTTTALTKGMGGTIRKVTVTGPCGTPVTAEYGIIPERKLAILEMAQAAGLLLVPKSKRNPLHTTTYGVGEMIVDAIKEGCRNFILGIGGSATNDAGVGMLTALGAKFYDPAKQRVGVTGKDLLKIESMDTSDWLPELNDCKFRVACDVKNPLFGSQGAAYVFSPQKGANREEVEQLEVGLKRFSKVVTDKQGKDCTQFPGAGAAGGLGYAMLTFLNATLESGVEIVIEETNLEEEIKTADYVLTGEGRLDGQTIFGKAPIGVAKIAKEYGATVIAFAGSVGTDATRCHDYGIDAYFSIQSSPMPMEQAIKREMAYQNLSSTVQEVFRLLKVQLRR